MILHFCSADDENFLSRDLFLYDWIQSPQDILDCHVLGIHFNYGAGIFICLLYFIEMFIGLASPVQSLGIIGYQL